MSVEHPRFSPSGQLSQYSASIEVEGLLLVIGLETFDEVATGLLQCLRQT